MFSQFPPLHQYALLDPDAYDFHYNAGRPWTVTVPAGTVWYALNLWFVSINGVPDIFHRRLNIEEALVLPSGTTISNSGCKHPGFAFICKPEKITRPANIKASLARRLAGLLTMPTHLLRGEVPGLASPYTEVNVLFPADLDGIMLRHTSTFDASWIIIGGKKEAGAPSYDAMNTLDELSDRHGMRFSGNTLCPLKRSLWDRIVVQSGNISGNIIDKSLHGIGVVQYNRLPTNW